MTEKVQMRNDILIEEMTRMLDERRSVIFSPKGRSMLPTIVGERDSVKIVRNDSPSIGDIALARIEPGHYVLHRIIGIDGDVAILRGDGNLDGTELCHLCDICGTADAIIHPDGKVTDCKAFMPKTLGKCWMRLPRTARRYLLAIYRRLP